MKILILSSSYSPESRSYTLCTHVQQGLEELGHAVTLYDARDADLPPTHHETTDDREALQDMVEHADAIIIGFGVHCYSISDSLKIILDTCFAEATGKFYGVVCAAGGEKSYLSTMHLTQICMNEWRMIQLPRVVYASAKDFDQHGSVTNPDILKRIGVFVEEFSEIGEILTRK